MSVETITKVKTRRCTDCDGEGTRTDVEHSCYAPARGEDWSPCGCQRCTCVDGEVLLCAAPGCEERQCEYAENVTCGDARCEIAVFGSVQP